MARVLSLQHSVLGRFLFVLGMLVLVLLVPWWLVLVISCLGIVLWYPFPEFLLPAILSDILYGGGGDVWGMFRHTIIFLAIFIFATFIRSRVRL